MGKKRASTGPLIFLLLAVLTLPLYASVRTLLIRFSTGTFSFETAVSVIKDWADHVAIKDCLTPIFIYVVLVLIVILLKKLRAGTLGFGAWLLFSLIGLALFLFSGRVFYVFANHYWTRSDAWGFILGGWSVYGAVTGSMIVFALNAVLCWIDTHFLK